MKLLVSELERLIAKLPPADAPAEQHDRHLPRRSIRELGVEGLASIIADYRTGATLTDLASKYGYNRVGISSALKQAGVEIRRKGVTPAQADEAERLYGEGQSLVTVAARFGVDAGTVRTLLIKRGVTMRPPSQSSQKAMTGHTRGTAARVGDIRSVTKTCSSPRAQPFVGGAR